MSKFPYKMPSVQVGDIVFWYPDGARTLAPFPAIVTVVGQSAINVNVFSQHQYNTRPQDGVRHIDDPLARDVELREQGAWDYIPQHKKLLELHAQVEELLSTPAR